MEQLRIVLPKGGEYRERLTKNVTACVERLSTDKAWEVIVREKKPVRTSQQNAMLWAMYTEILKVGGEEMGGWSKEDLHEFFLSRHFGEKTVNVYGRKKQIPAKGSSKLPKAEFSALVDSIIQFMAERGVMISNPAEETPW